jgi:predicted Rossmann fold nucleotide-binding protein DprA/Smf involved in DNA uptake
MELDSSLSWLALALTPGLTSPLSARLLERFGSPDAVFRAPMTELEGCRLPAPVAQAVYKKEAFKRAEKELTAAGNIDRCRLVNWTETRLPADAATNLRSARPAVCSRRCAGGAQYSGSLITARLAMEFGRKSSAFRET